MAHELSANDIVDVAIGIVLEDASASAPRVLITQRTADQVLGGCWELPGGKVEPDESPSDAVVRELFEETGINARPIAELNATDHRYDHAHVRLIPFICEHIGGTPAPLQVDQVRWVRPDELADFTFPQASLPVLDELIAWCLAKRG